MGIVDLFGNRKPKEEAFALDENREDLGEGMELVNISLYGYWKPLYLVDIRKNRRIEFMSEKGKESGYSLPDNRHKFP